MLHRVRILTAFLLLASGLCVGTTLTAATLSEITSEPFGTFNDVEFVRYTGRFEGATPLGAYDVPFEIVAPADPGLGNGVVVVEPPHNSLGLVMRDLAITREVLFGGGFSYATVGYGEFGLTILDPAASDVVIADEIAMVDDADPILDYEIMVQFAEALDTDAFALEILGTVEYRYAIGVSQSAQTLYKILHRADAKGLLDYTMLANAVWKPAFALEIENAGLPNEFNPIEGIGNVIFVESEWDLLPLGRGLSFRSAAGHPNYRIYEIAGAPHMPAILIPTETDPPLNPLNTALIARAAFLAGDKWTRLGIEPPPTTLLDASSAVDPVYGFRTGIARDANLNASGGVRLPDVEVGRAQFVASALLSGTPIPSPLNLFTGVVLDLACEPLPDGSARFPNHGDYVNEHIRQVNLLVNQGYLLPDDAEAMKERAAESDIGKPGNCD